MINDPNTKINGVRYLTHYEPVFSVLYTEIREKEGRILGDHEVKMLPNASIDNPNKNEWILRKRSCDRFLNHLKNKTKSKSILDIGCGNGWFSNTMASVSKEYSVIGLDINVMELEQGARVFKKDNLEFVYGDIFKLEKDLTAQFDIITLNACIQYFRDVKVLILILKNFLRPNGEIHIIDSPFYKISEIEDAKKRSLEYYQKMGVSKMGDQYYHHSIESIKEFEVMYHLSKSFINRLIKKNDSPFMWLLYIKTV